MAPAVAAAPVGFRVGVVTSAEVFPVVRLLVVAAGVGIVVVAVIVVVVGVVVVAVAAATTAVATATTARAC